MALVVKDFKDFSFTVSSVLTELLHSEDRATQSYTELQIDLVTGLLL